MPVSPTPAADPIPERRQGLVTPWWAIAVLAPLLWVAATAHGGEALPLGLSAMDLTLTADGDVLQEVEPTPPDEATETAPGAASDSDEPPAPDPGEEAPVDPATEPFKTRWNRFVDASRGLLTWELFKGRLTLRAGLRIQIDGTAAGADEQLEERYGDFGASLDARRLRAFAVGTIDRHLRYHLEYDLGADWGFKDAFLEGADSGLTVWGYDLGQFRIGHFKEPFSLERQGGSNNFGFLEWSLPVSTFAPGRNIGFMLHDTAKRDRVSWAAGFFSFGKRQEDNASTSTLSITGRVTGLPIWQDEGRRLLHLGASFSTREPRSSEVQYSSRPEARFVPFMIDTGTITSGKTDLYGLEFAGVRGPLWLQSEWIQASVDSPDAGNPDFWGAYVQVGWFITGEVRHYERGNGTFGRLVPSSQYHGGVPLRRKNGGAFEIAGRFSTIDLDEGTVEGGRLRNISAGLNWYISDSSRVMLEYIQSRLEDGGRANILLVRYQYNAR